MFTRFGLAAAIIAIILAFTIPGGYLSVDIFIAIIGILGILIPTAYFIVMYRSKKTTDVERSRILAYIPLFIASVMFWAIAEQGSTILALYADKRTQLNFAGIQIAPAWFQSLPELFIIIFAPIFAWGWIKLGKRQPPILQKFSLALLFGGLSFIVIHYRIVI